MRHARYSGQTRTVGIGDLEALATGAGILGTGGGGSPRIGRLRLRSLLDDDEYPDAIQVIPPEELEPEATVATVGGMGAPTISVEKLRGGTEEYQSLRAIERAADRTVDAVIPGEIGGANSMVPFVVAALADLPVVDGDGMGRAFPELQMCTFFINGAPPNFAAITDERGNQALYRDIESPKQLEDFARAITVDMGGSSGYAFPLMGGDHVSAFAVSNTVSLALALGEAVHEAQRGRGDPIEAACETVGGRVLFTGKVTDVYRRNREGFARGEASLAALDDDSTLSVEFQNEFLMATDDSQEVLASVPDLICIVDKDTAEPITTSRLRYGQRVCVVGVPAPPLLTTEAALAVIGPGAFGYDHDYQRLPEVTES